MGRRRCAEQALVAASAPPPLASRDHTWPNQPIPLTTAHRYVNLNYMGFHKILKKHDKQLPHTPCRQFYIAHLHNQPWVQVRGVGCWDAARRRMLHCCFVCPAQAALAGVGSTLRRAPPLAATQPFQLHSLAPTRPPTPLSTAQGNYSELMVILSAVFSQLRGDQLAEAQGGSAQVRRRGCGWMCGWVAAAPGPVRVCQLSHEWPATTPPPLQAFKRSTTKYWVRTSDVSTVKRIIIENMPGGWETGRGALASAPSGCTAALHRAPACPRMPPPPPHYPQSLCSTRRTTAATRSWSTGEDAAVLPSSLLCLSCCTCRELL